MSGKYPFKEAAKMLKVIAHPEKLHIVSLLEKGEMNGKKIQAKTGLKQSITSQHLNAMADRNILKKERRGNEVFYSVKREEVLKLLMCLKRCCG